MRITEELRKWGCGFCGSSYEVVNAIADRIDAEYQKAIRELNNLADASVILPVDADGEYIHIGDVMESVVLPSTCRDVTGVGAECFYAWETGCGRYSQFSADLYRRHHAPTVEDVLTEFGIDWEHESDCEDRAALLKEYAQKLQLKEE